MICFHIIFLLNDFKNVFLYIIEYNHILKSYKIEFGLMFIRYYLKLDDESHLTGDLHKFKSVADTEETYLSI